MEVAIVAVHASRLRKNTLLNVLIFVQNIHFYKKLNLDVNQVSFLMSYSWNNNNNNHVFIYLFNFIYLLFNNLFFIFYSLTTRLWVWYKCFLSNCCECKCTFIFNRLIMINLLLCVCVYVYAIIKRFIYLFTVNHE